MSGRWAVLAASVLVFGLGSCAKSGDGVPPPAATVQVKAQEEAPAAAGAAAPVRAGDLALAPAQEQSAAPVVAGNLALAPAQEQSAAPPAPASEPRPAAADEGRTGAAWGAAGGRAGARRPARPRRGPRPMKKAAPKPPPPALESKAKAEVHAGAVKWKPPARARFFRLADEEEEAELDELDDRTVGRARALGQGRFEDRKAAVLGSGSEFVPPGDGNGVGKDAAKEDAKDAETFDFAPRGDGDDVAPNVRRALGLDAGAQGRSLGSQAFGKAAASLGPLANLLADGRGGWGEARGSAALLALPELERAAHVPPTRLLPRMFYFENTYLGGSAAAAEHLRRLQRALGSRADVLARASAYEQAFDPPEHAGMALTAELDRSWVDRPTRVYLQVGLRGSQRFGWRRPPLDVVAVVDGGVSGRVREELVIALLRKLGPQDRLGVVVAGVGPGASPDVLAAPRRLRDVRGELTRGLERLGAPRPGAGPQALAAALRRAAALLRDAAMAEATVPGTQTVLLVTDATGAERVGAAGQVAQELTVQGVVTSVVQLGHAATRAWWPVANKGYGNYHVVASGGGEGAVETLGAALDAELGSLSKVVARLLRLNIRLAPGVRAVRVVGSRKLEEEEVRAVKAREVATDRALSKTLGVRADRGEDDDGIQTVIPYFYGGDSHVVLVELWVTRPGPVAEVTLKYKDMVNLGNATARASARLQAAPRGVTPEQRSVARNLVGARLAERFAQAARAARRGRWGEVQGALRAARALAVAGGPRDRALVTGLSTLAAQTAALGDQGSWATLADALELAHDRKLGQPPVAAARAAAR